MKHQLEPKAIWIFFIHSLVVFLMFFGFIAILLISLGIFSTWILYLLFLTFLATSYLMARMAYSSNKYELSDVGFKREYNTIIQKESVTIPYDKIMDVRISRGLIPKILGLYDLTIKTYKEEDILGQKDVLTNNDGWLTGLSEKTAFEIRDELIKRAKSSKNQVC